jgi:superfamily II DNA or RNA helicase
MLAIAYMAEKSAIMCPTSILANQIYEEAEKYLTPLGLKVVLVTQNSGATDEEINSADLLVGTHALLYRELPPLKAISIDEQHRFGTAQRRKLEELGATATLRPHHFQFSATPIPRTQALIQSNFVEVTLIKELPFKKEIETRVLPKDREGVLELLTLLKGEIEKGKQGIIVYPAVEGESTNLATLQKGRKFWEKYFSKVLVTHGKDREKEEILLKFREEGELLVTTTIIEVGISLPRLSVIAIVDADHFGLATLHQLRGRVGRYGEKGYCYLLTDNPHNPRLVQFSKILDGFQIAELDLKFRRAGDLLEGSHQSGESFRYFDEVEDREILEEVHNYLNTLEEPPAVVEPTQTSGKGDKREISPQPERGGEVTEAEKREVGEERGERKQKKQREQTKQTGQREQVGQRGEVEEVKKNGKGERVGERVGQRVGRAPENTHSHNLDSFNFYQKVEGEEKSGNFTPLSSKMGDNGGKGGENLQPLSSGESHSQSPSHLHSSTSISSSLTPKAPILGPKSPILEKEEEKLSPPDGEEGKKSNSSTHSILDSSKKSSTGGTKEEKISTQEPDSPTPPIFTSESESFDQNTFTYLPSRWEATFPFDFPQSDLQILPEKEKKKEEVTSNLPHQFHQNFPILAEEETKENLTSVNPKPADSSSPTSPTFQKEGEKIPKGEDLVSTTSKGEKSFSSQISTTPGKREGESPSNFGFKKGEGEVKLKRGEIQKEKKESTPFESDRKGAHLEKGKESFTSKRAPISPKPSEKERKKRRRREKTPHLSSPLHSIGREKNSTLSKNNTPSHPPTSEKGRLFPKDSSRLEKREKNSSLDTSSPKRSSSTLFPELEPLLDKFSSREKEFTERDSFSSPSQNPSSQSKPSTSNLFNSSPDLPHSSPPDQTSQNSHNPQNSGNSSSTPSKSTSSRYQTPSLFEGKK